MGLVSARDNMPVAEEGGAMEGCSGQRYGGGKGGVGGAEGPAGGRSSLAGTTACHQLAKGTSPTLHVPDE